MKKSQTTALKRIQPPFETAELRKGLTAFLRQPPPFESEIKTVGAFKWGVYAFFDYDKEPIYVGQTLEGLSSRIGRHLTNQRTDAVAMSVLDPFEVYEIELFPLPDLQKSNSKDKAAKAKLNSLELAVFQKCIRESAFGKILNEKDPAPAEPLDRLPTSVRGRIVSDEVKKIRNHPDTRIARRSQTIARLAQTISERQVQSGLRRTLLTQALRLESLAQKQFVDVGGESAVERKSADADEAQDTAQG